MSDPWETLAANHPADQSVDNGEWGQSDEWAQSKTRKSPPRTRSTRGSPNSPPRTRFTRGSPIRRNFDRGRVRTRSPSNSPPPRRQYRGRDRSRSPWRDREGSRSFRGNRGREASRSFRGRDREASGGREVSRSSRRPDFSNSPSPGFRGRNYRDRGRSPFCRNNSKEKSNGPGASWTKKDSDAWGHSGGPGASWTKKESDGWGQSDEAGSLSAWSKAAEDIKKNYNDKEIDGWGEKLGESGPDAWKLNNGNNNDNNIRSKLSPELGGARTDVMFRRERSSEWQRRGRESRERKDDENPTDSGWNQGQKWRDWSINALQNSIKDINWSDFKWTDTNNNENNNYGNNNNNESTVIERAVENQNPSNGGPTGDDLNHEPGANGNVNEMGESSSQLYHADGKLQNKPSENQDGKLQNDPDLPPLLYDPWDVDSELPQQPVMNHNNSNRLGPCEPSSFNAAPVKKVRSPAGYESLVENEFLTKPPGFEEVNPNNGLNPSGTVFDASQSRLNDTVLEEKREYPPLLDDPWASDFEENKSINAQNQPNWGNNAPNSSNWRINNAPISSNRTNNVTSPLNWGINNAPNGSNLGNNIPNSSNLPLLNDPWASDFEEKKSINVPNSSNWGNNFTNQSNLVSNAPISSNWGCNNSLNASNLGNNVPISSNPTNNAPNSSNWGCNNASSSSNLGRNSAPSLSNWLTNTSNSSNWANNLSNSSNRSNNNAPNWANPSSSKPPNQETNTKSKIPIKPPGFENLQINPSIPPGFEIPVQKPPKKPQIPKPKPHETLIPNPTKKESQTVSIFKRGITDFAEEKMEPFFTKGLISGKIYAVLINKFVAKVSSAVGPVEPRTEVEVHNFLRDQNVKLTRLAHEYLSMHVGRQVVQEVTRSTR